MQTEIPDGFTLICNRCGAKFNTFYYDFGSIEHNNNTNDWNLTAMYNRGDLEETLKTYNKIDKKCAMMWINANKEIKEIKERG